MFVSFKRIIKSGWVGFKRQAGLSLATVFIMFLVVSLATSLFLFNQVSWFVIAALEERVDISVYFKEITPEEEILKIKEEIAKAPEVKEIEYVSQQEAVQRLLERRPELAESVAETESFLNIASLNIKVFEASQYSALAQFLEQAPFANLIDIDFYQRQPVIEKIFSITSAIKRSGLVLSIVLAVIAFLVAFNQIKLAIYNSREDIGAQRLVGASNWFIRGPFLTQGVIAAVSATLLSLLVFAIFLYWLSPKAEVLFPGLNLFSYFTSGFFFILLIQLVVAIGLGVLSSLIAMRKYLKI